MALCVGDAEAVARGVAVGKADGDGVTATGGRVRGRVVVGVVRGDVGGCGGNIAPGGRWGGPNPGPIAPDVWTLRSGDTGNGIFRVGETVIGSVLVSGVRDQGGAALGKVVDVGRFATPAPSPLMYGRFAIGVIVSCFARNEDRRDVGRMVVV